MKRGPIIHGVLLVAALLFAYQTWTREEAVVPTTGTVVLWSMPADKLRSVTYDTGGEQAHAVRLERRSDQKGAFLWGTETRTISQYPERTPSKWIIDAGIGAPDSYVAKRVSKSYEFAVGDKGDEVMEKLAEMRAIRDLGKIDDEQKELYGLHDATAILSVAFEGGSHSLMIGDKVFGSADRYVQDPDTGRAYVIAHELIRELMTGETSLRMLKLHAYEEADIAKAIIQVGEQKRTLVRTKTTDDSGTERKTWAQASTPDKPDQTMANFLQSISLLRPATYESERSTDEMKLLVRAEYQDADGEALGWVELYERPPRDDGAAGQDAGQDAGAQPSQPRKRPKRPIYYMRTERTRVLAAVPFNLATRITEDIGQIFGR